MIRRPLRIPFKVGSLSGYAEIADPAFVLLSCQQPGCSVCAQIVSWTRKRELEKKLATAAVAESAFVMVA
jgi:hypothetical protein